MLRLRANRISNRSCASGKPQYSWRSRRPGRKRAGSIMSGREVAAITYTPKKKEKERGKGSGALLSLEVLCEGMEYGQLTQPPVRPSTPSRKVSSWFTTRSVTPVLSFPRRGARASNSSKNSIQGAAAEARANKLRTACSLAPIYLSRT